MWRAQGFGIYQAQLAHLYRGLRDDTCHCPASRVAWLIVRTQQLMTCRLSDEYWRTIAMAFGPHALVEAQWLQFIHGLPAALLAQRIPNAIRADALDVIQSNGGVVWAEIQVHLAAIIALRKDRQIPDLVLADTLRRAPLRAASSTIGCRVTQVRQRRLGVRGLSDFSDNPRQRGQRVVAFGRDIGKQAVRRVHHDQRVRASLPFIHQQGLRQQRDQGALAVAHDGDGFVRGYTAYLAYQHSQPGSRQNEIAAMRAFAHVQRIG